MLQTTEFGLMTNESMRLVGDGFLDLGVEQSTNFKPLLISNDWIVIGYDPAKHKQQSNFVVNLVGIDL